MLQAVKGGGTLKSLVMKKLKGPAETGLVHGNQTDPGAKDVRLSKANPEGNCGQVRRRK